MIRYQPFGGLIPKSDGALLPEGAAQVCNNARFSSGQLEAYNVPSVVKSLYRNDIETLYRFGQASNSETDYWFEWPTHVNCVKGPIANDLLERTFYTGDGFPKQTTNAIATSAVPYPSSYRRIGVPAGAAPACSATGTASATATVEVRAYIYTFVSDLGEESPPSPASNLVEVKLASSMVTTQAVAAVAEVLNADMTVKTPAVAAVAEVRELYPTQTVTVQMSAPPSGPFVITSRRLYRLATGTTGTEFLFVAELPAGTTSYNDTIPTEQLQEPCPTQNSALIPDNAEGLVAMANGMMACFVGYDVYFSDALMPYSWPVSYIQTTDYPIVGLAPFGTSLAVLTTGNPYIISGSDPQSMMMEKLPVAYSCLSKKSICSAMGGVIYAAPDGMVFIGQNGPSVLSEKFVTRREWSLLNPSSMNVVVWDERIFAFYKVSEEDKGCYIFDTINGHLTTCDVYATAAYTDPTTNSLFLAVNGQLVKWDGGAQGTFTWKSRRETLPMPKNFAFGQVLSSAYPLTMKVYADGVLKHTQTVTDENAFRLPAGFRARYWEIELSGSGRVLGAFLADSAAELQSV